MKPIIVYGSKSYSRLVEQIIEDCNRVCLGFIDDFETGPDIIGGFSNIVNVYTEKEVEIAIGIGYSNLDERKEVIINISNHFDLATLIHPNSYVAKSASIGKGSIIMSGAHVDYNVQIGQGVVCWPGSIINHDSIIKDNTFVSPGAVICGFVEVGDSCFVGANSTIIDNTSVEDKAFIKANSLNFLKRSL